MNEIGAKSLTLLHGNRRHNTLLIRTYASPEGGFGHLKRTLILAQEIQKFVHPLFLLDSNDCWSQGQVESSGFEMRLFDPSDPWAALAETGAILIDTRNRTGLPKLISAARHGSIPVASIHDLGLAPLPSDLVIDGSILPAYFGSYGDSVACIGTDYLILPEACRIRRRTRKRIRSRIKKVVVNLGGGNGSRFFFKVLTGLKKCDLPLEVVGFPGFCSWGQDAIGAKEWAPLNFRWLDSGESAIDSLFDADLVITAGGLSAYEALCVGSPVCALSYDRYQDVAVTALARVGALLNLGRGSRMKSADIASYFRLLDRDLDRRHRFSMRGQKVVDGKGVYRVSRLLRRLIFEGKLDYDIGGISLPSTGCLPCGGHR
jgi:spore coat polysaccharide biosynthesis predicted glycosyltransferase SpsG